MQHVPSSMPKNYVSNDFSKKLASRRIVYYFLICLTIRQPHKAGTIIYIHRSCS